MRAGRVGDFPPEIGDLGVNLKPARETGMTTIKVLNAKQAIAELEVATGMELGVRAQTLLTSPPEIEESAKSCSAH